MRHGLGFTAREQPAGRDGEQGHGDKNEEEVGDGLAPECGNTAA